MILPPLPIAPGYMATNNTEQLRNDESRSEEILGRIPAGRWGVPDDMMGPVVFLASSASDYVNGYTLAVDHCATHHYEAVPYCWWPCNRERWH